MTSGNTFPQRLTKIDDLTRPDHSYLTEGDECYFLGEYTARKGYAHSPTNNLVLNFKIGVEHRGGFRWRHKERAIREAALAFAAAITPKGLAESTLVPIPPSKAADHPGYDDRVHRMVRGIRPQPPLDVRELVAQLASTQAAHESESRPKPSDLQALYKLDPKMKRPWPNRLLVFDDVLTTGAHFKAVQTVLTEAFPGIPIAGLFLARRAPDTSDFEDFS